ncbi:MAG: PAS domain S-box protein, partial [Nitrospirae bacterium]|nr:PAS domain S-box protein [Nitrospirota bacterium]
MKRLFMALEQRTLKFKLRLIAGVLLTIALSFALESLHSNYSMTDKIDLFYEFGIVGVDTVKDITIRCIQIENRLFEAISAFDSEQRARALTQLTQGRDGLKQSIKELRSRPTMNENKKDQADFEALIAGFMSKVDQAILLIDNNLSEQAKAMVTADDFQNIVAVANAKQAAIVKREADKVKELAKKAEHGVRASFWMTIFFIGVSLLPAVLIVRIVGNSIQHPLSRIHGAIGEFVSGNVECAVPHTGYQNELGALARTIETLESEARQIEDQRWIKTKTAEMARYLQQATSFIDLSQRFMSHVAPLVRMAHGVFFIYEEDKKRLRQLGGYANAVRNFPNQYLAIGQGMVGQCALERAPITITDPPEDYISIPCCQGASMPRCITLLPVLHNNNLLAVLELATLDMFSPREQALLDEMLPTLAVSIEIFDRTIKTIRLLDETQRQAENMERQAAQLEEQQVEMEAQQREIKATEAWYRGIIELAPDGLLVADEDGKIIMANPQLETIFGYAVDELQGKPIETLLPHALRSHHIGHRNSLLTNTSVASRGMNGLEVSGLRKDGSEFPAEVG